MPNTSTNGWEQWKNHVLLELKRASEERMNLQSEVVKLRTTDLPKIQTSIAMLNVKSGFWGATGAGVILLVYYILPKLI